MPRVTPDQAVDWASKSPEIAQVTSGDTVNISGSGFLICVLPNYPMGESRAHFEVTIDESVVSGSINVSNSGGASQSIPFFFRFDSSLEVNEQAGNASLKVVYVLD